VTTNNREIRYELLRPDQLRKEQEHCPLIFVPLGPLEYHGPHLPLGTDPINATLVAYKACGRIGKGVVLPTLFFGTERERSDWELESLGFQKDEWIIGMDFPTAHWKSHYYQEHIFGILLASTVEMLIEHKYEVIMIVNGHGALNHRETINRISKYYSNTTDSMVVDCFPFPDEWLSENQAGHADVYETSLMLFYESFFDVKTHVDLSTLPERDIPLRYPDFSIVDGPGFTKNPSPNKIVTTDPRNANVDLGKNIFEAEVETLIKVTEQVLKAKGA